MTLSARGIVVRYGALAAVDGVDLTLARSEVLSLLGPSGCGKTTLLRVVAGLLIPDAGTVAFDGQDLDAVPTHRRGFGLMFQDHALFPHFSVAGNVAFGLRMAGLKRSQIRRRTAAMLELMGLADHGRRAITELSGGEQQRVALARALAPEPRLLMLDEPLGALDRILRDRLMVQLRQLFTDLGTSVLYVTHDQEEALVVADRLAIVRNGRIVQSGPAIDVWGHPADDFVAEFLGHRNLIDLDGRRVVIRPEAFRPAPGGRFAGEVVARSYRGNHWLATVQSADGSSLQVDLSWLPLPEVGDWLTLNADPDGILEVGS